MRVKEDGMRSESESSSFDAHARSEERKGIFGKVGTFGRINSSDQIRDYRTSEIYIAPVT